MKNKIKILIGVLLIMIIISYQVSYAFSNLNNTDEGFLKINKSEIVPGETVEITLDISKIEYDEFKIVLTSNIENGEIYVDENKPVDLEKNTDGITIEIDRTEMNLDKITLYYSISESINIGTIIKLIAQIVVELENNEEQNTENIEINEQSAIEPKEGKIVQKQETTITVVEDNSNNEEDKNEQDEKTRESLNNEKEQNSNDNKDNNQNEKSNQNGKADNSTDNKVNSSSSSKSMSTSTNKTTSISSSKSEGNTESAIYNGSSNNYLSSLEVEGIDLNTTFKKENGTYFISVKDTSQINVNAVSEEDTAKVTITGNGNIQAGENKILITVTAENGDVRYYRIFVSCEV